MNQQEYAERCLAQANAALGVGRLEDALRLAWESLAHAHSVEANGVLVQALLQLTRLDEALEEVDRALARSSEVEWYHRLRALVLLRLKRGREGLEAAREAVRLNPEGASNHAVLSEALLATMDATGAAESARTAIELDPEGADWHRRLGDALLETNAAEAERHYRAGLALHPLNPFSLNNLGVALMKQRRMLEAAVAFKSAVLADPTMRLAKRNTLLSLTAHLNLRFATLAFVLLSLRLAMTLSRHGQTAGVVGLLAGLGVALAAISYLSRVRLARLRESDSELVELYDRLRSDRQLMQSGR